VVALYFDKEADPNGISSLYVVNLSFSLYE